MIHDQTWDTFVRNQPRAHLLQLSGWGHLKSAFGWTSDRVILNQPDGTIIGGAQLLFKPLPMRLGTLAYLPFAPYLTDASREKELWQAIDACARRHHASFLKWEAGIYINEPVPDFARLGFKPSLQTIQPPNTILIDITGTDNDVQGRMNQGTRRNIRKAYKNEIHYFHATRADVERFIDIMQLTGARNEFGVHDPEYYRMMFDRFVPQDATLILAEHEGDTLAGNFVFQSGKMAQYLVGASNNHKRDLMASYGVQWEGIQWARQRNCQYYDLWGIPDEPEATLEADFQNRDDGLWGVYRFKRGWGGTITRSVGAWDKVYNPLVYMAYRTALRIRNRETE